MKFIKLISILVTLCCLSLNAHAEGGCPSGMQPYQPGSNQPWSCMPIPGYSGGGASTGGAPEWQSFSDPAPVWQDRWGAIAGDKSKGIIGTVTGLPSESAAQQAAMADCAAKGGIQCKIENSYVNGCTAMTVGDRVYNIASKATLTEAIASGIEKCREVDKNCTTNYSACSLPVRTR